MFCFTWDLKEKEITWFLFGQVSTLDFGVKMLILLVNIIQIIKL